MEGGEPLLVGKEQSGNCDTAVPKICQWNNWLLLGSRKESSTGARAYDGSSQETSRAASSKPAWVSERHRGKQDQSAFCPGELRAF